MVERQEFYRKMNVSVRVHDDDLELEIATPAISQSEDPSSRTYTLGNKIIIRSSADHREIKLA